MPYVCHVIMLHSLNVYSVVCQLYLRKAEKAGKQRGREGGREESREEKKEGRERGGQGGKKGGRKKLQML